MTNQNAHLCSSQVPPFWADLVRTSTKLHVYTERQVDTWKSLPKLTLEIGDFTSEQTEISNVELGTPTNKALASSLKGSEVVLDASASEHTSVLWVFFFKIRMHLGITILSQMSGQCSSQLISIRVDFGARHAWQNFFWVSQSHVTQQFRVSQSHLILTSSETSPLPHFSWLLHPCWTTMPSPSMTSLVLLSSWLLHPSKMKILKANGWWLLSSKQTPTFHHQIWGEYKVLKSIFELSVDC